MTDTLFSPELLDNSADFGSTLQASALEGLSTEVGDNPPLSGMLLTPEVDENAVGVAGNAGGLSTEFDLFQETNTFVADSSVDSLTGLAGELVIESDDPLLAGAVVVEGGDLTFEQATLEVATIYREVLGREADAGGLEFWAGRAVATSVVEVRMAIANSPEGEARVKDIYRDVLGREADAGGLDYWTDILGETALNFVKANIANSDEARVVVSKLYEETIGEPLDPNGAEIEVYLDILETSSLSALATSNFATA